MSHVQPKTADTSDEDIALLGVEQANGQRCSRSLRREELRGAGKGSRRRCTGGVVLERSTQSIANDPRLLGSDASEALLRIIPEKDLPATCSKERTQERYVLLLTRTGENEVGLV